MALDPEESEDQRNLRRSRALHGLDPAGENENHRVREKTSVLADRAEKLGIVFEYAAGFIVAKWPATIGPEQRDTAEQIVRQLGGRLVEFHRIVAQRARSPAG